MSINLSLLAHHKQTWLLIKVCSEIYVVRSDIFRVFMIKQGDGFTAL